MFGRAGFPSPPGTEEIDLSRQNYILSPALQPLVSLSACQQSLESLESATHHLPDILVLG